MKKIALALLFSLISTIALAQTAAQWGINRGSSPWTACLYDANNICQGVFTLPATGGGALVPSVNGGTGVNNGASLITVGGSFTLSGAYAFTGTLTGATTVTFPTTGTLATTAGVAVALPSATTSQLYGGTGSAGIAQPVSLGSHLSTPGEALSTDATNVNTASTIVARDGSGNFTAGTITANLTGTASAAPLSGVTGLGSGVATALGYAANATGGLGTVNGTIAYGDCLKWGPGVQDAGSACATPGGASGTIQYNNAGSFGGFTVSGDGSINTSTGALTITKTGGVAFGSLATQSSVNLATQITGNLPVANLASGTNASSSTFFRGDGTWQTLSGSGNVSNSGTPTSGQVAVWTGATTVQGVTATGTGSPVLATSPVFTGTPTTPTQTIGDASTKVASTQFVGNAISSLPLGVGFRNRVINGGDDVDQRNAFGAQTIIAGAALAYTDDRFFAYSTGANVSGQNVAGSVGNGRRAYQITGATGVTGAARCQRVESANAYDLAGQNVTFSVSLSDSLLTSVNWSLSYANTADAFGSLASPTVTAIGSGVFTVSPTLARYSATVAIPSAAITGLQICLSVGAQISGTWMTENWQLEAGAAASAFERRPIGVELALCQRYLPAISYASGGDRYVGIAGSTTVSYPVINFPVTPRVPPTGVTVSSPGHWSIYNFANLTNGVCSALTFSSAGASNGMLSATTTAGSPTITAGALVALYATNASALILWTGCEL